jgi:hypothetical protein
MTEQDTFILMLLKDDERELWVDRFRKETVRSIWKCCAYTRPLETEKVGMKMQTWG